MREIRNSDVQSNAPEAIFEFTFEDVNSVREHYNIHELWATKI